MGIRTEKFWRYSFIIILKKMYKDKNSKLIIWGQTPGEKIERVHNTATFLMYLVFNVGKRISYTLLQSVNCIEQNN